MTAPSIPLIDYSWHTFGLYEARGPSETPGKEAFRVCHCACGQVREIHYLALEEGRAVSCGCDQRRSGPRFRDLTGQLFGKWLVLLRGQNDRNNRTRWDCRCLGCGRQYVVIGSELRTGNSTQCRHCSKQKILPQRWYVARFNTGHSQVQEGRELFWEMACICGREPRLVRGSSIRRGERRSCGCHSIKRIIGQYFGFLYVLAPGVTRRHGSRTWLCQCTCGYILEVSLSHLKSGDSQSCGCRGKMCPPGTLYGRLTVVASAGHGRWQCQCSCGREVVVPGNMLRTGHKRTCGQCYRQSSGFADETNLCAEEPVSRHHF